MSDLHDLYQSLILDHNRRPRNRRRPEHIDRQADGYNPLCGDRVTVYVSLDGDVIKDVGFDGGGCAISTASASLMTEALKGKTVEEAREMFERFRDMVTAEAPSDEPDPEMGKLGALSGVCQYPARVKCATLVWHTVLAALNERGKNDATVTTE